MPLRTAACPTPTSDRRLPVQQATLRVVAACVLTAGAQCLHGAEPNPATSTAEPPALRFVARSEPEALRWQQTSRERLFALLMGGQKPDRIPLAAETSQRVDDPQAPCVLEEVSFQSLPNRRAHAWLAVPRTAKAPLPAILAIPGHGGSAEDVVRGNGLYWYGRALANLGYVVIAPDVSQHTLQHTNWSLMGERTWDALRCLDYLETRPEVDPERIAVAGLSLGGETAMYVAALDERPRLACSSGWLTTVANMKQGHCPCWNFPGLESQFDFADIFACIAPRPLICEIGELETAPGGFPLNVARTAFDNIRNAYAVWNAADHVQLDVHPAGHVFHGVRFWALLDAQWGTAPGATQPPPPSPKATKAPSPDVTWLTDQARRLLQGCQVAAQDGTPLYTPDGKGNYRALWTRDFAYMAENAGDLLPLDHVRAGIRYLLRGVRADGAAPDRVRPDGVPVYVAGPEDHPLGEPNLDNAQFLAVLVDVHLQQTRPADRLSLFREWAPLLEHALHYLPRTTNGLIWNDPAKPHSPYGFTDTIGKTGELLFESLLDWSASRRLARWYEEYGPAHRATAHRQRATAIESHLDILWDSTRGAFLAATVDCRQVDVWGNAYALHLGIPLGERRAPIVEFLARHFDQTVWNGQVRHLLRGEHWQRLLTPVEPERYQNGAYWATASGWLMDALAPAHPDLSRRIWQDLLADFRQGGICECVNTGYRQLPSYVVSATNPLAAARRLGF